MLQKAKDIADIQKLSEEATSGEVESALVTTKGNMYTGVSIKAACGVGFCAEYGAVSNMVTNGETNIRTIVAVYEDGKILPPCGRCRELIYEINPKNIETDIILDEGKVMKLKDLLPERWQDRF